MSFIRHGRTSNKTFYQNESETKPKAKQTQEMEAHIKTNLARKGPVYSKRYNTFSSHHHFTMRPITLVERLDILMASKSAGNTGVRNELVSVCDELLRQNLIDKHKY